MLVCHHKRREGIWSSFLCRMQGMTGRTPTGAVMGTSKKRMHIRTPAFSPSDTLTLSSPNTKGEQLVRYPVEVTRLLQLPLIVGCSTPGDKQARIAMKKRIELTFCQ
jgi:hypothetical protein